MAVRPRPLNPRSFADTVDRSPFALVRLDRSSRQGFHPGVAEYFDAVHPGRFVFGTLSRTAITQPGWLEASFRAATGALRHGVQDGYFLLESGLVIGHHLGVIRPSTVSYGDEKEAEALRERVLRFGFGGRQPRGSDLEAARQIVAYLDPILARKLGGDRFGTGDRYVRDEYEQARDPDPPRGQRQHSGHRAPPPTPAAPPEPDPYETLGVTRATSDEDIKKAYREQMKLNHPDKVSHLSPALQKFATQQVLELKKAYDAIKARRSR